MDPNNVIGTDSNYIFVYTGPGPEHGGLCGATGARWVCPYCGFLNTIWSPLLLAGSNLTRCCRGTCPGYEIGVGVYCDPEMMP